MMIKKQTCRTCGKPADSMSLVWFSIGFHLGVLFALGGLLVALWFASNR